MKVFSADITTLLFFLRGCPDDFLLPSALEKNGLVHTNALIKDIYRMIYGDPTVGDQQLPGVEANTAMSSEHLTAIQIGCWLMSHHAFANQPELLTGIERFFFNELSQLAGYVKHSDWVKDEDRSEEFIRLALKTCDLYPQGESEAEALDRLDGLSTLKRYNVLQESSAAFQRIKDLRQKMAEEKAREAANVYGRE